MFKISHSNHLPDGYIAQYCDSRKLTLKEEMNLLLQAQTFGVSIEFTDSSRPNITHCCLIGKLADVAIIMGIVRNYNN